MGRPQPRLHLSARRGVRLGLTCLCAAVPAAAAQGLRGAPRYAPAQFACARFATGLDAETRSAAGATMVTARVGRAGVLVLDAAPAAGGPFAVRAWWDALAVWHVTDRDSTAPDTDGVLGGPYRLRLAPDGSAGVEQRPFVPDAVAEVMDVGAALDALLPRLPGRPMGPGERWTDGRGLVIERLRDSLAAGGPYERYRARFETDTDSVVTLADGTEARERVAEEGRMTWTADGGLVAAVRETLVDRLVAAVAGRPQRIRTEVRRREWLRRAGTGCDDPDA